MGYGYAETFLVIFLTSPGVIIPTTGSFMGKLTSVLPPAFADLVSSGSDIIPAPLSAAWQIFWVWVLSLPGEKSVAFGWTMYIIYLFFLFAYMYTIGRMRIAWGV
jgi:hypothetical protein